MHRCQIGMHCARDLARGGRHDGRGLTGDASEIVDRQFHPDDDHGGEDQGRHAGIHDGLWHGTPYVRGPGDPGMSGKPGAQTILHTVQAGLFLASKSGSSSVLRRHSPRVARFGQQDLGTNRRSANLLRTHRPGLSGVGKSSPATRALALVPVEQGRERRRLR